MAEERTLGLARATESVAEEPSKEELQRRMDQTRDSISQTVTEIKETVAQQVETVKDALDWREYVKKRPVAWSLGALGVGFFVGYGIAAAIRGSRDEEDEEEYAREYAAASPRAYAGQPILGQSHESVADGAEGPSLLERFKGTSAYDRLSREVGTLGDRFVDELSTTAHTVVLPALLTKIKNWIGLDLSETRPSEPQKVTGQPERASTYQPVLERSS